MRKQIGWVFMATLLVFALNACDSSLKLPDDFTPLPDMQTAQPESKESPQQMDDAQTPHPEASALPATTAEAQEPVVEKTEKKMKLQVGETVFTATLADNSSAEALMKLLEKGPISIDMRDYGNMEKVGTLSTGLPRNDEQITTAPGDLILYQGNAFVIYYAPNSWNFTRLGKIDNVTAKDLKAALGSGNVTVTLSKND